MFKIYALLLLNFFVCFYTKAQTIQGTWKGREDADGDSCYFELSIQVQDNLVTGESYLLFTGNKFQRFSIAGTFNPKDSTLEFKEIKVLDSRHGFLNINCYGTYIVHIKKTDTAFLLTGTSMNYTRLPKMFCAKGFLKLSKPYNNETTIINKENSISVADALKDTTQAYTKRVTQAKTTIISTSDTVHIRLYDNGEIDNDTISVYFNDRLLLFKKRLNLEAISFDIILDKSLTVNKLLFVAENLGDIPPNTGLMIITEKNKRYELNLSADYETNSSVEFVLKK